jgi:hypothetical protein
MRDKRENYEIVGAGRQTKLIEFTSADIMTNILTIQHNMNIEFPSVVVYDNSRLQVIPASVNSSTPDKIIIDLTGLAPFTGNWYVRISQ